MFRKLIPILTAAAFACAAQAAAAQATAASAPPKNKAQASATWSDEGLEKRSVKGLDAVYARPGANLSAYHKIRLAPITVAFRKHWEKQAAGAAGGARISAAQAQKIRDRLALLVQDEMTRQLKAGGYNLVAQAGDDVLDVSLSIVDLYVTAPDIPTLGRVQVYALSAGEMTLIADLRDSGTRDIVMRVYDHARATENFRPERITDVENEMEARKAAAQWAKLLRTQLDLAQGKTGAKS